MLKYLIWLGMSNANTALIFNRAVGRLMKIGMKRWKYPTKVISTIMRLMIQLDQKRSDERGLGPSAKTRGRA